MNLTDILLTLLILAVLYAIYVLRMRIRQQDAFRKQIEESQKSEEHGEPPISVLHALPPTLTELNPKVLQIERELDKMYVERESGIINLPADVWDGKEKQLISQMVDILVRDADYKMFAKSQSQPSGSK